MALLRLTFAVITFFAASSLLHAEDTAGRSVEVRFVPPGPEGTVSLGIYNASGKLVRVLCDEWPLDRFRVGRDALAVTWDGLDGVGRPVPPGAYTARGFVVGDIAVSGEAFHFNDWIDEDDSPRIVHVGSCQLLPGGDILLGARVAGARGALVRYSPESDVRWHNVVSTPRPQPARSSQLAVSDTIAFVLLDGELQAAKLEDGSAVALPIKTAGVKAIAARGSRLAVLDGDGLRFYALPDFGTLTDAGKPPADFGSLALLDDAAVASGADGSVWLWKDGWSRLDIPGEMPVRAVSGGSGKTFWALQETSPGVASVVQYSPDEGRLAEWSPRAEDGKLEAVSGSAEKDYFVASLVADETQRTVAIRRRQGGQGWEYVFDKKITASSGFGWTDGKIAASSSELPEEIKVRLSANPLDPTAPRTLTLRAVANDTGAGLATTDGLPLLRVSDEPGFGRVMLVAGAAPNTARFFQGDGACVEEYSLKNLGDITAFDAGTIEMTAAGEATPPPAVEPPDEQPLD